MTKFRLFCEEHAPAGVVIPWTRAKVALATLGLQFGREHLWRGEYRVTEGENYIGFSGADVVLKYDYQRVGGFVVYKPRIAGNATSSQRSGSPDLMEKVRDALSARFAPEMRVPLPERVVTLPVPSWVEVWSTEDMYASMLSPEMFESEAREALDSFIATAEAAFAAEAK